MFAPPLGTSHRRAHKSGTGVTATYFLSDGTDEIYEYSSSGSPNRRLIPGPAIDEPIAQGTGTGLNTYKYFHTNHQGSTIALTGSSGGVANGPYIYDPYGNCTLSGGGACSTGNLPAFTGQVLDAETGLYYYRARYYSSVVGRFLQTDPVGYTADLNLYAYVGNDPTDKTDPTGRASCTSIGAAGGFPPALGGSGSSDAGNPCLDSSGGVTHKLPSFAKLQQAFPHGLQTPEQAYSAIGHQEATWAKNACVVRMEICLHDAGARVRHLPGVHLIGRDGRYSGVKFDFRVRSFDSDMRATFGNPSLSYRGSSTADAMQTVAGHPGIIEFHVGGSRTSSGHFDLWNGSRCVGTQCEFSPPAPYVLMGVDLWETPR